MRVGVIGPQDPDSLADNILSTLPSLGVEGVGLGELFEPKGPALVREMASVGARLTAGMERRSQRASARRAAESGCDVIINVQQHMQAETARTIRASGSKLALWYPDALANVGRLSMFEAPYDAVFLKDSLFARRMRETYGVPAVYLPEACNPERHRPEGPYGTEPHVVVVGNVYPTRGRLLRRLLADGVPLKIYGGRLPGSGEFDDLNAVHTGRPVTGVEKARVFRSAVGVLNNLHPAEMSSVNCRLFEAAGSGAVVLCESRPDLADLYVPGKEVVAFSNYEELLRECRELITGPVWAHRMADRAAARSVEQHTYEHRLRQMLEHLT